MVNLHAEDQIFALSVASVKCLSDAIFQLRVLNELIEEEEIEQPLTGWGSKALG